MASKKSIQGLPYFTPTRLSQHLALQARQSSTTAARRHITTHHLLRPSVSRCQPRSQNWWHSDAASTSRSRVYGFEKVKSLSSSPSPDHILIDVREPSEYKAGFIPTAINIPITSQPDALFLSPEEFEDRFGFEKPPPEKELVFYCKAGVRSSAAAQLAQQQGYERVAEYRGSWMDWQKNEGRS